MFQNSAGPSRGISIRRQAKATRLVLGSLHPCSVDAVAGGPVPISSSTKSSRPLRNPGPTLPFFNLESRSRGRELEPRDPGPRVESGAAAAAALDPPLCARGRACVSHCGRRQPQRRPHIPRQNPYPPKKGKNAGRQAGRRHCGSHTCARAR